MGEIVHNSKYISVVARSTMSVVF